MTKKLNKATFNYGGKKITLAKSKKAAAVRFTPGGQPQGRAARGLSQPMEGFQIIRSSRGIDGKLDRMRALPSVQVGTHVFNVDGAETEDPLVPTGNIYVEFFADSNETEHLNLFDELHLNILDLVGPGQYFLSVTGDSPNPIKCVIALQRHKLVTVAEPEFITKPAERAFTQPTGQHIGTQWHLDNTGGQIPIVDIPNAVFGTNHFKKGADAKVKAAWENINQLGTSSVRIAVIDTGFDVNHPSLKGNGFKVRNPFSARDRSADVSPFVTYYDGTIGVQSHGTSCAAVAAGALDARGILGAAPNAKIIPIKLDALSDTYIKAAFEHAMLNGADIISCSLGYPQPVPLSTFITSYLRKIAREGRNGKGIPMFFAAGNANPNSNFQPREVSDFAAHTDGICVTASNSLDEHSDYSFYGKNAFLTAPTNGGNGVGITTASVELGSDGASIAQTYTSGFGGTSSATPLAAGVCALMLSVNPNLSLTEIKSVLRNSCDKIGGTSKYDSRGHSRFLGYGRINALKAVQKSKSMLGSISSGSPTSGTSTGTSTSTSSGNTSTGNTGSTSTSGSTGTKKYQQGRVLARYLNVRSGPSTAYPKVGRLIKGDAVNLIRKINAWYQIDLGRYVHGDYLRVLNFSGGGGGNTASATQQGRVISTYLNVRTGAGTWNKRVSRLRYNDLVNVHEINSDGWYRIDNQRWVYGKYIRMV